MACDKKMVLCLLTGATLICPAYAQSTALSTPPEPVLQKAPLPEPESTDPGDHYQSAEEILKPAPVAKKPVLLASRSRAPTEEETMVSPSVHEKLSESEGTIFTPDPHDPFTSALMNVYMNHPQLKAERESLKALDESVNEALSGFKPDVSIGYSKGRQRAQEDRGPWFYTKTSDKTLDVVQPVFNGGGTLAAYKSAKNRVKAGRAQLVAIEQQVLLNAVLAYTDVVQKQSILDVNHHNVSILGRQMDAAQERFKVGEVTKTDQAQSQARLAFSRAAERQAEGDLAAARATFRRVIGYDAPAHLSLPPLPPALPRSIEEATSWAQAAEPTLETARHLEKAADSDVDVNTAALLPSVNLEGRLDRSNGVTATSVFGPRKINADSVMVNVSIPIYQSGAEWSRVRAARSQAAQARYNTIDTNYGVIENAMRVWEDFNTSKAVIASNRDAVRAARVALEGMHQENLYGTRTVLDLLNTEQDLFSAQLNLVNAQVNEKQQAYRLLAATGRLTAENLALPVALHNPKQHYNDVKYQMIGF